MRYSVFVRRWRPWVVQGEVGVAILEYVLLVALVALAGTGALVYFGRSPAGPANQLNTAASAVGVGGYASPGQAGGPSGAAGGGGAPWCKSGEAGCTVYLSAGAYETITFSPTGGVAPYSYSLQNAPGFLTLEKQDETILVGPASCPVGSTSSYTYGGVSLLVTDDANQRGELTFAVAVSC